MRDILTQTLPSPLGDLLLVAECGALIGVWFVGQRHFAPGIPKDAPAGDTPTLAKARAWLNAYFAGERPTLPSLPLAPRGSPFRQRVWRALLDIPYGETETYGALARRLGTAPRAIGGAVGRNPISILIPCHRVVGAHANLTGYAGGLDRKTALLRLEGCLP